jgi:hypothetical protein
MLDETLPLLADRTRRRLVSHLMDAGRVEGGRDELARILANPGPDGDDPDAPMVDGGSVRDDVRVALGHVHLPKLHHAGVIDWDVDAGVVRRGPTFDRVAPLVRLLRDSADALPGPWDRVAATPPLPAVFPPPHRHRPTTSPSWAVSPAPPAATDRVRYRIGVVPGECSRRFSSPTVARSPSG